MNLISILKLRILRFQKKVHENWKHENIRQAQIGDNLENILKAFP